MEHEFLEILSSIVCDILSERKKEEEVKKRVQDELESKKIWEVDNLLITDCYYAWKHITEERISRKEWIYFQECFEGTREYNLEEKIKHILKK